MESNTKIESRLKTDGKIIKCISQWTWCLNEEFVASVELMVGADGDGASLFAEEETSTTSEAIRLEVVIGVGPVAMEWSIREERDHQAENKYL